MSLSFKRLAPITVKGKEERIRIFEPLPHALASGMATQRPNMPSHGSGDLHVTARPVCRGSFRFLFSLESTGGDADKRRTNAA